MIRDRFLVFLIVDIKITAIAKEMGIQIEDEKISISNTSLKFLSSLNVKYIITPFEIENDVIEKVFETNNPNQHKFNVYKINQQTKRLFITSDVVNPPTNTKILQTINSEKFEPTAQIILEEETDSDKLDSANGQINIISETSTHLVIDAELAGNGYLVLADSYYPGWEATIDKKKTAILPANINSKAVYLQSGKHQIEFIYKPKSLQVGLILTILLHLFLVGLFVKNFRNRGNL